MLSRIGDAFILHVFTQYALSAEFSPGTWSSTNGSLRVFTDS
jgi:hypothetical protein